MTIRTQSQINPAILKMMQTGKNEQELPPPRQTNPKVSSAARLILVDPRTLIE